jgi:hypothetical protein
MAKNSKQVALPAAAQNMAQWAVEHLPTHLEFDTTSVGEPETASQPIDHVPDQAHVPTDVPPMVTLPDAARHMSDTAVGNLPTHLEFDTTSVGEPETASQPIDHVPDQAHVPTDVPPMVTLPDAARHMSDTAVGNLPDHLEFNDAFVGSPGAATQLPDHVPDQAEPPVPEVVPDMIFPSAAVDHVPEVAKTHLALHTDWFV